MELVKTPNNIFELLFFNDNLFIMQNKFQHNYTEVTIREVFCIYNNK